MNCSVKINIANDNSRVKVFTKRVVQNLSVLENHHWRCAMGCLWESGLLEGWSPGDVANLQEQIRSLILATDITRQQEFLTKFKVSTRNLRFFMIRTIKEC